MLPQAWMHAVPAGPSLHMPPALQCIFSRDHAEEGSLGMCPAHASLPGQVSLFSKPEVYSSHSRMPGGESLLTLIFGPLVGTGGLGHGS